MNPPLPHQPTGESMRLINGVPADQWGTYCPHSVRVVGPDPTMTDTDFPNGVVIDPWPCHADGCTREAFDAAGEAEQAQFEQDRWDDFYAMIAL